MLQKHVEALASLKVEELLDDSHSVVEEAAELGCVNSNDNDANIRVCECGNVLIQDAIYCRKCGRRWQSTEGPVSKEREMVVALACMHHEIEGEVQKANAELKTMLEAREAENEKSSGPWAAKAMAAQTELTSLQNKRTLVEAKLLMARVNEARSQTMATALEEQACICSCAQELLAVRKLLERTQGLCAESTLKFKRAAMEAYSLSDTLNKVQGTLRKGAEDIQKYGFKEEHGGGTGENVATNAVHGGAAVCLKVMNDARQQAIFSRLYGTHEDTSARARREERRARLLRDSFHSVYQLEAPATATQAVEPGVLVRGLSGRPAPIETDSTPPQGRTDSDGSFLTVSRVSPHARPASPSQRQEPARSAPAAAPRRGSNTVTTPRVGAAPRGSNTGVGATTPRATPQVRRAGSGGQTPTALPPVPVGKVPGARGSGLSPRPSPGSCGSGQLELGITPATR